MIKGFSYYIKRIVRQPAYIFLVVFILIISYLAIHVNIAAPSNQEYFVLSGLYDDNGTVNLSTYSMNCFGQPLQGNTIQISTLGTSQVTQLESGNFTYPDITSQSNGYANITLGNFTMLNGLAFRMFDLSESDTQTAIQLVSDQTYSISSQLIINASNPYYSIPFIAYFGPNGTSSPQITLYMGNFSFISGTPNTANLSLVGRYSGFHLLALSGIYGNPTNPDSQFYLYIGNNTSKALYTEFSGQVYGPPPYLSGVISATGFLEVITGFILTSSAILVMEVMYSREVGSGVLDLVLAQPVGRRRLMFDRFASSASIMLVTLAGIVAFDQGTAYFSSGNGLPAVLMESMFYGIAVAMLSMMAFSLLFSKFHRYGFYLTMGLFILFAVGFPFAGAAILSAYGSTPANLPVYFKILYLLSPTDIMDLMANSLSPGISLYIQPDYMPANLSISLPIVIAVGILWIIGPVLLAYLAQGSRKLS